MLQRAECSKCNRMIVKELINSRFEYRIAKKEEDQNLASCMNCIDIVINKIVDGYE